MWGSINTNRIKNKNIYNERDQETIWDDSKGLICASAKQVFMAQFVEQLMPLAKLTWRWEWISSRVCPLLSSIWTLPCCHRMTTQQNFNENQLKNLKIKKEKKSSSNKTGIFKSMI